MRERRCEEIVVWNAEIMVQSKEERKKKKKEEEEKERSRTKKIR
jgi:hypothetical protein